MVKQGVCKLINLHVVSNDIPLENINLDEIGKVPTLYVETSAYQTDKHYLVIDGRPLELRESNIPIMYISPEGKKEYGRSEYISEDNSWYVFRKYVESVPATNIHTSWSKVVRDLKKPLIDKLIKREEFTKDTATELVNNHVKTYHPLLDTLIKELIEEGTYKSPYFKGNAKPKCGVYAIKVGDILNGNSIQIPIRGF